MVKPVLVIMAAGMGSRYGGLKQIDPIDQDGHIIMDFSIYDAKEAGFEKVIFIIKKENEQLFRECIGDRVSENMEVEYVFQEITNIPKAFEVPVDRQKPWGTGHAILSCLGSVKGGFAVINADDYYGKDAFKLVYDYLTTHHDDDKYRYAMVGYELINTVTENGHVARGVCEIDHENKLVDINERTQIEKRADGIAYTEDKGETWIGLPDDKLVSMNLWGFSYSILEELERQFPIFLQESLEQNPLKGEFFLPSVVSDLLQQDKASVEVLASKDKWYGVTYAEDKPFVMAAIQALKEEGKYPEMK